jgi:DNA-binding winged helix-turn-helix (wHTH) protein
MRHRFGDVTFDSGRRDLFRGPRRVHLSPKALHLLELLLSRRPDAVSKGEILAIVWPGVFVSEGSLAAVVKDLRRAIGEGGREGCIRTLHGFGYAFDGEVEEGPGPAAPSRPALLWAARETELSEGANLVGRERTADVWVGHPSVSREHARVTVSGEKAELEDLGSKNGTWLGERRVEGPLPLADGDEIRVGEVRLRYRGPSADPAGATRTAR